MNKISVVVPIYNVENYLKRCVNSILNQTYPNLEIILVDDGSTDNCGMICDDFERTRKNIRVIHKKNGGLSDARNVGIESATGEYIVFVDSDDWLDSDMIEILFNTLKKYDADIAECSYRSLYSNCVKEETACTGDVILGDSLFALEGMLNWKYFKPNAWNKLYKREVIGNIRYPKGRIHEDEFTTYKFFCKSKRLAYIDISKYNYNKRRTDSITGEKFREANLDGCFAFRERVQFFYDKGIDSLQRKMNDVYCWHVLESMYKCYKYEIKGEKVDCLLKQVKKDVDFFRERDVSPDLYKDFKILAKGIRHYGYFRGIKENEL